MSTRAGGPLGADGEVERETGQVRDPLGVDGEVENFLCEGGAHV